MNANDGVIEFLRPADYGHRSDNGNYGWEISTSYQKGMGRTEKITPYRRYKKPTLVEGVQYHPCKD